MFESLEARCLLTATFVNGTLTLTSVVLGETFLVIGNGTIITVDTAAEGFHAEYAQTGTDSVQALVINSNGAGGGAADRAGDTFIINASVNVPTTINAASGPDVVQTGSGPTEVNTFAGADIIVSRDANDTIDAGAGKDIVDSAGGNDSILGGADADLILAGAGNDTVDGGGGTAGINDQPMAMPPVVGEDAGDDTIYGDAGNDSLLGGEGAALPLRPSLMGQLIGDLIIGGAGDDTIEGGLGRDLMDGGAGSDVLSYADHTGGLGVNVVYPNPASLPDDPATMPKDGYDSTMPIALDNFPLQGFGQVGMLQGTEVVTEGDLLYAGLDALPAPTYLDVALNQMALLDENNFELFWGGDDTDRISLSARTGPFTVLGNAGVDTIIGSGQPDVLNAGPNAGAGRTGVNAFDNVSGLGGNDTLIGEGGPDDLSGGADNDSILGGDGQDILRGNSGNDILDGEAGNDLMTGGSGDDTMLGGLAANGADTLQGDDGVDTADYTLRTTNVGITFDLVHDDGTQDDPATPADEDELDFVTETTEIGLGGSGNDTLDGRFDSVPRTLDGGGGNDTMFSGAGPDALIGGAGTDTVSYANRTVGVNASIDGVANDGVGAEGDNISVTVENLIGGSGADTLTGGAGNNVLTGRAGADVIDGGGGSDTADYGDGLALHANGVSVSTDGVANDGGSGENDNVSNVEGFIGTPGNDNVNLSTATVGGTLLGNAGNDTLTAGSGADSIVGGAGNDVIDGRGGADTMSGGADTTGDTLTYAGRSTPFNISINSATNVGSESNDNDSFDGTFETIAGGGGNDRISIVNSSKAYNLQGLGGNDTISGGIGSDTIDGGTGNDSVRAGAGLDSILGNDGNDTLQGGSGNDTLNGQAGIDILDGQTGADLMIGGAGNDTANYADRNAAVTVRMDTDPGNDGEIGESDDVDELSVETVFGGRGNDTLIASGLATAINFDGRGGNDTLTGGNGDDTLGGNIDNDSVNGSNGDDLIDGFKGNDTLVGASGDDTITGGDNNDRLTGSDGDDDLNGDGGTDTLDGGNGDDDFDGGAGNDTASYSARSDDLNIVVDNSLGDGGTGESDNVRTSIETVIAGSGDDFLSAGTSPAIRLYGGSGADTLTGGTGPDLLQGDNGADSAVGGDGADTLYGTNGNDTLNGGNNNDRVLGGPGNDVINGQAGNDTLIGQSGSDTMAGGSGADQASYSYESRPVKADIDDNADDGVQGENDNIRLNVENLEGGTANDTLAGSAGSGRVDGNSGNDLIFGNDGSDTLSGNAGSDTLNGGNGNDILIGGAGPDRFIGSNDTDTADYSASTLAVRLSLDDLTNDGAGGEFDKIDSDVEILLGGSGNDSITGGAGSQTLNGGAGNDTIRGAAGDDSLIGGTGLDSVFGDSGADILNLTDGQADTGNGGIDADVDTALQDFGNDTVVNVP